MDPVSLILALGAAQGFFLASILLSRADRSHANRYLAMMMLAFSVDLGVAVLFHSGAALDWPHVIGIDYPLALVYGPALYLYASRLTQSGSGARSALAHFLPFVLLSLSLIPFYLLPGQEKLAIFRDATGPWAATFRVVAPLKLAHAVVYLWLTLRVIRAFRSRIRDSFSSVDRINLAWLSRLIMATGILGLLIVGIYFFPPDTSTSGIVGVNPDSLRDQVTLLLTAVLVYTIGFMGMRQPEVFVRPPSDPGASVDELTRASYVRSGMDTQRAAQLEEDIRRVMNGGLYRQANLSLQDLADAVHASAHNVTEVLNTRIGQSFYDFVNGFRVDDARQRLADPAQAYLTVIAIGLDAGFNSKSSFNAVFKKMTGQTPSAFRAAAGLVSSPAGMDDERDVSG